MVQSIQTVGLQILILCVQIAAGYLFYRKKLLSSDALFSLTNIVIYLALPCMFLTAFNLDLTPDSLRKFSSAFLAAMLCHIIAIIISFAFIRKKRGYDRKVLIECCVFSNCGLFGLPLLSALMGPEGVFLGSPYNLIFGILFWTIGVLYLKSGQAKITLKNIFLNPCNICLFVGFSLSWAGIPLPTMINKISIQLGNLAVPLSMIIIGCNLAQADLRSVVKDRYYWFISFLSLVLIPFICMMALFIIGIRGDVLVAVIISVASPAATTVAVIAEECKRDTVQASCIISLSTLLSIITLLGMIILAKLL